LVESDVARARARPASDGSRECFARVAPPLLELVIGWKYRRRDRVVVIESDPDDGDGGVAVRIRRVFVRAVIDSIRSRFRGTRARYESEDEMIPLLWSSRTLPAGIRPVNTERPVVHLCRVLPPTPPLPLSPSFPPFPPTTCAYACARARVCVTWSRRWRAHLEKKKEK